MRIRIDLGTECNNFCIICSVRGEKIRKNKIKEIFNIIKNKRIESINFLGGEPTINKYIIPLIKECKRNMIKQIELTSNGRRFFYPTFCKKIIDSGLTRVHISIYGYNKKIHEAITRTPGSFRQTILGLKNLLNYNIETNANIVVNKMNEKYLYKTVELINNMNPKVHQIRLIFINPFGQAKHKPYLIPKFLDLKREISKLKKFKKKLVLLDFPYCVIDNSLRGAISNKEYNILDNSEIKEHHPQLKQKLSSCSECKLNKKCEGIFQAYLLRYGEEEFKPIK